MPSTQSPSQSSTAQVLLRIPVDEQTLAALDAEALKRNVTVEQVAVDRLFKFAGVESTSSKPIVLSDTARQRIEQAIGRNLSTADELANAIVKALAVRIDSTDVQLTPYLLDRLKSRAIGVDFDVFMARTIKRLLEEFAGLR